MSIEILTVVSFVFSILAVTVAISEKREKPKKKKVKKNLVSQRSETKIKRKHITEEEALKIKTLLGTGISRKEVVRLTGRSRSAVARIHSSMEQEPQCELLQ